MPKSLFRIVAVLLVPCLLADSIFAAVTRGMEQPFAGASTLAQSRFQDQALSPASVAAQHWSRPLGAGVAVAGILAAGLLKHDLGSRYGEAGMSGNLGRSAVHGLKAIYHWGPHHLSLVPAPGLAIFWIIGTLLFGVAYGNSLSFRATRNGRAQLSSRSFYALGIACAAGFGIWLSSHTELSFFKATILALVTFLGSSRALYGLVSRKYFLSAIAILAFLAQLWFGAIDSLLLAYPWIAHWLHAASGALGASVVLPPIGPISIVQADLGDLTELLRFRESNFEMEIRYSDIQSDDEAAALQKDFDHRFDSIVHHERRGVMLKAIKNGELVGYVQAIDIGSDIVLITEVATERFTRRQGIGLALNKEAIRLLRAEGVGSFRVVDASKDGQSGAMYEKLGFRKDGVVYVLTPTAHIPNLLSLAQNLLNHLDIKISSADINFKAVHKILRDLKNFMIAQCASRELEPENHMPFLVVGQLATMVRTHSFLKNRRKIYDAAQWLISFLETPSAPIDQRRTPEERAA